MCWRLFAHHAGFSCFPSRSCSGALRACGLVRLAAGPVAGRGRQRSAVAAHHGARIRVGAAGPPAAGHGRAGVRRHRRAAVAAGLAAGVPSAGQPAGAGVGVQHLFHVAVPGGDRPDHAGQCGRHRRPRGARPAVPAAAGHGVAGGRAGAVVDLAPTAGLGPLAAADRSQPAGRAGGPGAGRGRGARGLPGPGLADAQPQTPALHDQPAQQRLCRHAPGGRPVAQDGPHPATGR